MTAPALTGQILIDMADRLAMLTTLVQSLTARVAALEADR